MDTYTPPTMPRIIQIETHGDQLLGLDELGSVWYMESLEDGSGCWVLILANNKPRK